jgi:hypothetical protein
MEAGGIWLGNVALVTWRRSGYRAANEPTPLQITAFLFSRNNFWPPLTVGLPWMVLRGRVERHLPKGGLER